MREKVISEYLAYLNIPISKKYYIQCMISHPSYPSLLSVADTLEELGIEHMIARIEEEYLSDIAFPYVLQFDKQGGILALIKNEKDLNAHKENMKYWNGVIIKAEPTQTITPSKQKIIGRRSRRFHGYSLGVEKTGTTTIHHMFKKKFRSAHEPLPQETIQLVIDFLKNRRTKTKIAEIIKKRDKILNLEMESNHLLVYFSEILVDIYPEAKFVVTIREPYSYLSSIIDWHLTRTFNIWKPYINYFFAENHKGFEVQEQILKDKNLFSLDTFLNHYANHYNHITSNIPKQRRVIIRTSGLNHSMGVLSSFFNIDKSFLKKSHANANSRRPKILNQLDEDFVRKKIWEHCSRVITEHFPETLINYKS